MGIMEKLDLLIEKYLGIFRGTEVYVNPTAMDFRELKKAYELRFIVNVETSRCFVWDSTSAIHCEIFNQLVDKNEFEGPKTQRFADVYNKIDVIAGYAEAAPGNKMKIRYAYGNDVDEGSVKAVIIKLFTNPDKLFETAAEIPDEYR
jgi:hypothetical protein